MVYSLKNFTCSAFALWGNGGPNPVRQDRRKIVIVRRVQSGILLPDRMQLKPCLTGNGFSASKFLGSHNKRLTVLSNFLFS